MNAAEQQVLESNLVMSSATAAGRMSARVVRIGMRSIGHA